MSVQHLPIPSIRSTAVCGPVCYLDIHRAVYANVICKTFLGRKKVQNTFSNKELQRHGLKKEKPERFCPTLHCLFIILSLWHIGTAVKWWYGAGLTVRRYYFGEFHCWESVAVRKYRHWLWALQFKGLGLWRMLYRLSFVSFCKLTVKFR